MNAIKISRIKFLLATCTSYLKLNIFHSNSIKLCPLSTQSLALTLTLATTASNSAKIIFSIFIAKSVINSLPYEKESPTLTLTDLTCPEIGARSSLLLFTLKGFFATIASNSDILGERTKVFTLTPL